MKQRQKVSCGMRSLQFLAYMCTSKRQEARTRPWVFQHCTTKKSGDW